MQLGKALGKALSIVIHKINFIFFQPLYNRLKKKWLALMITSELVVVIYTNKKTNFYIVFECMEIDAAF